MKVTILCSDADHPVNPWLKAWRRRHASDHDIQIYRDKAELVGGDILFLVSCGQIVTAEDRALFRHSLVLHASDLPEGRGWSPHIWAILEGAQVITVSLLEAEDKVDTGAIWAKRSFEVPNHALHDEIHRELFETEVALMDEALVLAASAFQPDAQDASIQPTYYRKRSPSDSEIDPGAPLSTLFNTIRVMDPQRYPAFFRLHGHTYTIELKKVD